MNEWQKRVCLNRKEKSINKGYFERLAGAGDCVGAGGSDEFSLPEGEILPREVRPIMSQMSSWEPSSGAC